jgi:NAD(P)-dependent dehydrogenase (short-subunit alcohol dehydrogenase family)
MAVVYDSLENKIVVVTGAAGILGSEVVTQLLHTNAIVCAVDLGLSKPLESVGPFENLRTLNCDVSDPEQVTFLVNEIEESIGPIHALHNNAATKTDNLDKFFGDTLDYDLDTWNQVMSVNLTGMYLMARESIRHMAQRQEGVILQTASIYGASLGPDDRIYEGSNYLGRQISSPVSYTVSKAGVHGLTNHLATQFGKFGVRVNTLTPGGINSGQNSVFEEKYSNRVPLGRMATAKEVASVAVFLMSGESKYVTGQNVFVDGGLSAW